MKLSLLVLSFVFLLVPVAASSQGAPDLVWETPTPSGLANSILGAAWSPLGDRVMVGSTDRWLRVRRASDGALVYSILEPHRSGGVSQILYSKDGGLIGVHNRSGGMTLRVQRAADGTFLGNIGATLGANGLITFAPDATLQTSGAADLGRWRFSDLTVFHTTGSGYDRVTTVFNFSPDGALQTAASRGNITVQRRSDGAIVRFLGGGSVVAFSPDSQVLAAWAASPNEIVLWRTSDWAELRRLRTPEGADGVSALRFTPDGTRLVSGGYLPFVDGDGYWQQTGVIRFWRLSDGALQRTYDQRTSFGVTSPVAWSPDATRFVYGLYDGTAAVVRTPEP